MKNKTVSPKIVSLTWGCVRTSDGNTYKDVKLFPGGSRAWDWSETGTHHTPGIQPADVEELLKWGVEVIILSKGIHERLQVCAETKRFLEEHNVSYKVLQTEQAVDAYNKIRTQQPTGALIHSTC